MGGERRRFAHSALCEERHLGEERVEGTLRARSNALEHSRKFSRHLPEPRRAELRPTGQYGARLSCNQIHGPRGAAFLHGIVVISARYLLVRSGLPPLGKSARLTGRSQCGKIRQPRRTRWAVAIASAGRAGWISNAGCGVLDISR